MRDYKKYDVWHKAHEVRLFIYRNVIIHFSKSEQFDLSSQTKRSAYSILLSIVEGCGRNTDKDFVHFLDIALDSAHELEYCILLAKDLSYVPEEISNKAFESVNEIKAKLINLIKLIRQ
ncbi:MAG: four helix bundle protein [Bacteroidota bacterium]|nr:four helix bundle protein [Bacteroidota bacterium]